MLRTSYKLQRNKNIWVLFLIADCRGIFRSLMNIRKWHIIYTWSSCTAKFLTIILWSYSHLTYALSVRGTSIKQQSVQRLVQFQNQAVRICNVWTMLHNTIVVQSGYLFPHLVRYHFLCLMFHQYHCDYGIATAWATNSFGHFSGNNTKTEKTFAHSLKSHLSLSQHSFRYYIRIYWIFGFITTRHQRLPAFFWL